MLVLDWADVHGHGDCKDSDSGDENGGVPLQTGQQLPSSVIWSASIQSSLGQSSSGTIVSHSTDPSLNKNSVFEQLILF